MDLLRGHPFATLPHSIFHCQYILFLNVSSKLPQIFGGQPNCAINIIFTQYYGEEEKDTHHFKNNNQCLQKRWVSFIHTNVDPIFETVA